MATGGIDRDNYVSEVSRLGYEKMITMSKAEAQVLIGVLPEDGSAGDSLAAALDYAQGDSEKARYVLIYIEE